MLDLLLDRPDLPPIIRIVQARRAASGIRSLLSERGWLPTIQGAELVLEAEEGATLDILANAGPHDLPEAVAFLIDHDMLTASLIIHAACQGVMLVVAECLAGLSRLPLRRVEEMMYESGKLKALHARCGLPQGCYWTLQAACDVASDEQQDGLRLSAEEFGAVLIEKLLTRYEAMPLSEQPRNLDYVSRYAAGTARDLALRLRSGLQRAA